jgi:hypothetical protein
VRKKYFLTSEQSVLFCRKCQNGWNLFSTWRCVVSVKFVNSDGEIEAAKLLLCLAAVRVELP